MAIQYADGPIVVRADDWQQTINGVTVAVKLRHLQAVGQTMALMLEKIDGDWVSRVVLDADVQTAEITAAGGPDGYIQTILAPKINAWLAQRFSPTGVLPTPAQEVAARLGKFSVVWVAGIPQVRL